METPILKIDALRRCIRRVREVAARDPSITSLDVQEIIVLNLQRACEQAIDLANFVCAFEKLDIPRTSAEVFTILEQASILAPLLALSMRRMVGFRTVAVHEYRRLDPAIVRSIVTTKLEDFEFFVAAVGKRLKIATDDRPKDVHAASNRIASLTVIRIDLEGDHLGDDFTVSFAIGDSRESMPCQIISGQSQTFRRTLAHFSIDDLSRPLKIKLSTVEKDPIVDDLGESSLDVSQSGEGWENQILIAEIQVQGKGRGESRKRAKMTVVSELNVTAGRLFVDDISPDGWLIAQLDGGSQVILPHSLEIECSRQEAGRELFKILEGAHLGRLASAALGAGNLSHFVLNMPRMAPARLSYARQDNRMHIEGLGDFATRPNESNPVPVGTYPICIPDLPHARVRQYLRQAPHAKLWFRIGMEGDRYIHPGTVTQGCITVSQIDSWEQIYHHLIYSRSGDQQTVGTLEVT